MPSSIHVTREDLQRLRHILSAPGRAQRDEAHLETLRKELDRAAILNGEEAPPDVITMGTRVRVRDLESDLQEDYTVVYPWEVDVGSNRVSVLAPLGTALLGYRTGDRIEWRMPGGVRRLRVEKILHQPQSRRREAPVV
jgi:regulator of nucleoside diphosphate kinase